MVERWYVVEAYEGRDEDVALRLCSAGYRAWRPVDVVRSTVRDKLALSKRPVRRVTKHARFGRYVFLRHDLDGDRGDYVIRAVRDMRGVNDFVRAARDGAPSPVPDELIEFYREYRPAPASADDIGAFDVGDMVRIIAGPFSGFEARIEAVDKRGALRVEIQLFGHPTPLMIEVGYVELLVPGPRPPKSSTLKRRAGHGLVRVA